MFFDYFQLFRHQFSNEITMSSYLRKKLDFL